MAFNPNSAKYAPSEPKYLPVILLLDVSGSMHGDKIQSLHKAVTDMVATFVDEQKKENLIKVAIITFGCSVDLCTPHDETYVDVAKLKDDGIASFVADGMTPLGAALTMAKDLIEDRNVTLGRWYVPSVVLVSDGAPNDSWERPFDNFVFGTSSNDRSVRAQRISVCIGHDVNIDVMKKFASGDDENKLLFMVDDASHIANVFKKVTMSISQSLQRQSQTGANVSNATRPSVSRPRPSVSMPHSVSSQNNSVRRPSVVKKSVHFASNAPATQDDEEF